MAACGQGLERRPEAAEGPGDAMRQLEHVPQDQRQYTQRAPDDEHVAAGELGVKIDQRPLQPLPPGFALHFHVADDEQQVPEEKVVGQPIEGDLQQHAALKFRADVESVARQSARVGHRGCARQRDKGKRQRLGLPG